MAGADVNDVTIGLASRVGEVRPPHRAPYFRHRALGSETASVGAPSLVASPSRAPSWRRHGRCTERAIHNYTPAKELTYRTGLLRRAARRYRDYKIAKT
jgi:hypothetical protein